MNSYEKYLSLDSLEDELDYDYSISEIRINTMEAFSDILLKPFLDKDKVYLYRGEQINTLRRPLIPTIFRDRKRIMPPGVDFVDITSRFLLDFYRSRSDYFKIFSSLFGSAEESHLYDLCSFSQHYMGCSPLLDFSKSLYVAISFALMGRKEFEGDIVLYVLDGSDTRNYTCDKETAERWLQDYHVRIYEKTEENSKKVDFKRSSPTAKILDIASNDSMKFQQGVFLLLDNFNMVNNLYITKNVRSSVNITKCVINSSLCLELTKMIERDAPWYCYKYLLDIRGGIDTAINNKRSIL